MFTCCKKASSCPPATTNSSGRSKDASLPPKFVLRSRSIVGLVLLYWSIGRDILAKQGTQGWGTRVIDRLAHDLQNEFPGIEGFSPRSLKYMRALAEAWPEETIVQQLIAQLPW